jgi:hypothetical protein
MEPSRILSAALILAAIASAGVSRAQAGKEASTPQPAHTRMATPPPMLFATGSGETAETTALDFRSQNQMTQEDRDLAAGAESSIRARAGVAGLEFNQGKWSYEQVVCSALPNHLFLRFTRNRGAGDVSLFTASIPRGGAGQVRVIPIQRRGYSLFSPAPINALTIAAFNQIRAEEQPDKAPAWLATGLCYAALAGTNPQIGPPEANGIPPFSAAPPATLEILRSGGAVIRFTDVAAPRPMEWTMIFGSQGTLLKATHSPAAGTKQKAVARTPAVVQGKTVNSGQ